jgi:hypothetical protein
MVAGARDISQATAMTDVHRILAELSPLDQGVVLASLVAELARLQPEPAQTLALMFEAARVRMGQPA